MPDDPSVPTKPTHRKFLLTTGSTAAATVIAAYIPAQATGNFDQVSAAEANAHVPNIEGAVPIMLRINGEDHQLGIDPRTTLLDCILETVVDHAMRDDAFDVLQNLRRFKRRIRQQVRVIRH